MFFDDKRRRLIQIERVYEAEYCFLSSRMRVSNWSGTSQGFVAGIMDYRMFVSNRVGWFTADFEEQAKNLQR